MGDGCSDCVDCENLYSVIDCANLSAAWAAPDAAQQIITSQCEGSGHSDSGGSDDEGWACGRDCGVSSLSCGCGGSVMGCAGGGCVSWAGGMQEPVAVRSLCAVCVWPGSLFSLFGVWGMFGLWGIH